MSAHRSPWDMLAGKVAPPAWNREATVHRLSDDLPPNAPERDDAALRIRCRACKHEFPATTEFFYRSKKYATGFLNLCKPCYAEHPSTKRKHERKLQQRTAISAETVKGLQQLAKRATVAILEVLPPWTLIEPGSEKEAFARKVPACVWWQFPDKQWPFPASAHQDQP